MGRDLLFLHGLDSAPGGYKPRFLEGAGYRVLNPALPKESFIESVRIARAELERQFERFQPGVIVGSSRGGAVAMALGTVAVPMVLIAPAWRWCAVEPAVPPGTIVLHSPRDEVIPIEDSRELAARSGLPEANIVLVGDNHAMNDPAALAALCAAIERQRAGP